MTIEKEFGKLTVDQFRELVKALPEIRSNMKELPELIRSTPRDKVDALLKEDFCWALAYEWPFLDSLALLILAMGRVDQLREAAHSADPQQAALDLMRTDELDDWDGGFMGLFDMSDVIALVTVLQRNILSIMLYHRPLSALVEEVRQDGNWQEAFFKAVRVDRSIISCPTFAVRLARAELENDKQFFLHLRSSLKGPSKKHWEAYYDLRYALCILRELGFNQMSDAQLEDLLVDKLKLYPKAPSARKNLRKQFTESKKVQRKR